MRAVKRKEREEEGREGGGKGDDGDDDNGDVSSSCLLQQLFTTHYRWSNQDSERESDLSGSAQQANSKAQTQLTLLTLPTTV